MATPNDKELRFNAKYLCKYCKETWKVKKTSHLKQTCKNPDCREIVRANTFEVIDKLVTYYCRHCNNEVIEKKCSSEVERDVPFCKICGPGCNMEVKDCKDLWKKQRKFGTYYCEDCNRTWRSGNSWKGVGQQCRQCQAMFLPHTLDPLQHSSYHDPGIYKPPHQQDLCGKCKELGHSCENYTPPETQVATDDEIPSDDEDDTSIITTNSSQLGDDDNATPINSDEDDISDQEQLDKEMNKLNILDTI